MKGRFFNIKLVKFSFFVLIIHISPNNFAATRYWVGGSGTWNSSTTTNWSASSGGASGASAPTSADNVIFDASSGLTGATVTTGTGATCNTFTWSSTVGTLTITSDATIAGDFTWSGAGGTLAGSSFADLNIGGSLSLNASMTLSATWLYFIFTSTSSGKTITTNGKTLPYNAYFTGIGGGWTTSGALSVSYSVRVSGGTLSLGNTLSCATLDVSGGIFTSNNFGITLTSELDVSSGTINLGSSSVGITGTGTLIDLSSGATVNAGTSTITLNSSSTVYSTAIDIYLGTKTIYNLNVTSNCYLVRFFEGGTINNLTFNAGQTVLFENGTTYTVNGTLTAVGTCTNYINFFSKYAGSAATLSVSGAQNTSYLQLKDITKSGAGSITCDYCVNAGTNTNITFTNTYVSRNLYWRSATSGSWGTAANWSTNSDGTTSGNTCLPTIVDNIYFNANAITSGSQTITINKPIFCNNIDFTGLVNSPTWSNTSSDYPMFITGNYTMSSGMGNFNNEGRVYFLGTSNQLIKTSSKYLTNNFVLFYGTSTYYAEDDMYLSSANDMLLTKGTLSARNNANTTTYNIYIGGDWLLNNESLGASATFTYSTSTVYFTGAAFSDITNGEGNANFYNLNVNKSNSTYYVEPTSGETVVVNNNLTVSAGYYYMWSSSSSTLITGNLSISSANTKYQQSNGTTTIAGTVTLGNSTATLPLSGGTFTWNNNSTTGFALNTGTMTVSGATVNIGTTNTHTTSVLNVGNSSGSGDATLTVSSGTLNIADKLYVQSDGIMNVTGGTINIKATTTNVGTATSKWVIDTSGQFKQSGGTINVLGAYNTTSTYPAVLFNTSAVTTTGNITAGTIILKSTTTGVTNGYYVNFGGKTIFNLQTSVGSGTPTYTQLTSAVVIKGSMTIDASTTYAAAGLAMSIATDWTNNGTFTPGGNTVTFNGTSILNTAGNGAGKAFYNVILNGTSATLAENIDIDNNFTLTSGTWDVSGSNYDMNIGGNWSNSGTFTPQSGTVTFDGTSSISTGGTGAGKIFYNVSSSGTSTLAGNIDIDNHFSLSGGTWDVSGSNYSMNIGGDFVNSSGTFTCQSGTVTFDGAATQYINVTNAGVSSPRNDDITFYNVVIDGADVNIYYDEGNSRFINIVDFTVNNSKQCSILGI